MPSDDLVSAARAALAPRLAAFRAAVANARDDVAADVRPGDGPSGDGPALAFELGPLASGRVDVGRLARLAAPAGRDLDGSRPVLARAHEVLRDAAPGEVPLVEVPDGAVLRDAVAGALARLGRAFGAARVVDRAREGRFDEATHGPWLASFPFSRWTRSERAVAPPLLVSVDGGDLLGGALAEFLDGSTKLVLLVRGRCAPAPLVRLVTPGVHVLQTTEAGPLERFAAHDGPGVAAIVPEEAARFVHDPAAGPDLSRRLVVSFLPETPPRGSLGGQSARQQAEEVRQLAALASPPRPAPADPVDRLASWLLKQADSR